MIVPKPLLSSNCTPASIFRIIEKCQPTLLIDEMDSFQDSHEELRCILNSGHTRSVAQVIRTVGEDHEPRVFSTWTPMALAAIGKLPDTLEDRSLRIDFQRKKKSDKVQRFPRKGQALRNLQDELGIIQRQCARWVADHVDTLTNVDPAPIHTLSDRANDNWYSLLSIAEVIGGKWSDQARIAAVVTSKGDALDETVFVQLLEDIKGIFDRLPYDRLPSGELCKQLGYLEERPWAHWRRNEMPITPCQLAKGLKGFGITSRDIRLHEEDFATNKKMVAKGYLKADFSEAWERYCTFSSENPDSARYNATTPMNTGETPDFQSATDEPCSVSEKATSVNAGAACSVVAGQNQEYRAEHTQTDLLNPKPAGADIDF
jgi:putative DNA primase/helicase